MVAQQRYAETRFEAEVVVVGSGWSALCAALEARRAGHRVLLAADGTAVPWELTVALSAAVGDLTDPHAVEIARRVAAVSHGCGAWCDPVQAELVIDRLLEERGVELLLYAEPLAVTTAAERVTGVLMGGKDGFYQLAAGTVIDATDRGLLWPANPAVATVPLTAEQWIFFQFASDAPLDLPADLAGCRLRAVRTWPTEVAVVLEATAADGESAADLARRLRFAISEVSGQLIAEVPALANAAVSHTGHRLLPLSGSQVPGQAVGGALAHPALGQLYGAGAWVGGGYGQTDVLARSGTAAGAMAQPGSIIHGRWPVPEAEAIETDVIVAGGGTGGAVAAIAAGRQGARVVVPESSWFLGGIGTGGGIHSYYHGVTGGLQDEVDQLTRTEVDRLGGPARFGGFSPEAKKIALERMAVAAGVELWYGTTVADVLMDGARLAGVVTIGGGELRWLSAKAVVDATGDGDLAAQAGAEITCGRERDGLTHAYSQVAGRIAGEKIASFNFDAGYCDATDVADLTRARRVGLRHYWLDEGRTPENRLLYMAPLLGLRQSRHIVPEYQLTLQDQVEGRNFDDAVAYGSCHYDNHAFDYQYETDEAAFWCWYLGHWRRFMKHGLPYRSLLPQGVEGLVMGSRAVGVSHDAHMLFRMQRDMQRVGEAAGVAAALSALDGVTPRELDRARLQAALVANGAILAEWRFALPEASVDELVAALEGDDPTLAAWRLYTKGEAAVPALLEVLESGSADARWWAAGALAMLQRREAVEVLREAVASRDEQRPLTPQLLKDKGHAIARSAERWVAAIPMLGRLEAREALTDLIGVLESPPENADAFLAAIRAVGEIGGPEAIAALEHVAERQDLDLAAEMQESSAGRGGRERDVRWQLDLSVAEALATQGITRADLVEPYLDDERALVRQHAARIAEMTAAPRQIELPGAASEQVRARRHDV